VLNIKSCLYYSERVHGVQNMVVSNLPWLINRGYYEIIGGRVRFDGIDARCIYTFSQTRILFVFVLCFYL